MMAAQEASRFPWDSDHRSSAQCRLSERIGQLIWSAFHSVSRTEFKLSAGDTRAE
jgi:hypothetical protein